MTDIKRAAVAKIAQQLANLNCFFKIVLDGEALHDTLPIDAPTRTRIPRRNNYMELGVYDGLYDMQPGDVVRVEVPDGIERSSLQPVLAAFMTNKYGKGTYMTQQVSNANAVDVLRLS